MLAEGTADIQTPDPLFVRITGPINGSWLVWFKGIPHDRSKYVPVP